VALSLPDTVFSVPARKGKSFNHEGHKEEQNIIKEKIKILVSFVLFVFFVVNGLIFALKLDYLECGIIL
jgi:hypothetical protein